MGFGWRGSRDHLFISPREAGGEEVSVEGMNGMYVCGEEGGWYTLVRRPLDTLQHCFPVEEVIFVDGAEVQKGFVGRVGVVF